MIPYGRQDITDDDIQAVIEVLRSDFITQGPMVPAFEQAVAEYCGAPRAAAVSSGTAALHLACLALDLGPGDSLWTTPISFVASANCARYCGADVGFVDIDPVTLNISIDDLARRLDLAERNHCLPKAVVAVHFRGVSCDMQAIRELADRYGFHVIEDACHALGGRYKDEPVGACRFSDLAVFSFHPVKGITTGEGGMVLTRRPELAERIALLRSHGITRDPVRMRAAGGGAWYYEQLELGYNYRMTDFQAALGRNQLRRLDAHVEARARLAASYDELLAGLPLELPGRSADARSAHHLYVVRLRHQEGGRSRAEVFESMRSAGVGVNVHYIPIHTQPYYRDLARTPCGLPNAERYYEQALTLPLYARMSGEDQLRVVRSLREALQ